ncbi:hypothetical protein XA68_11725 [Ophiocordyceps unilateralis]|uniref:Uncharacterized protein n=1 Tax=Ophiocordyceps unilateralis TaxID=268505 RepID=A0A2A9PES7_OPHUN|nr:hypothetical protein XA68_11725 [Ophiocordyceps unilateralis]
MRVGILLPFGVLPSCIEGHEKLSKVEKLSCGAMKDSTLSEFLTYTVFDETTYNTKKLCVTRGCVKAVVEMFPDDFIKAMEPIAELGFVSDERYLSFISWVLEGGVLRRRVCWIATDMNVFPYYEDTIGAISAYLINPALSDKAMYYRFPTFPNSTLRENMTVCFKANYSSYQQIRNYLPELQMPNHPKYRPRFKTYKSMRWETSKWSGLLGFALFESTRESYSCPEVGGCGRAVDLARPMLPRDYEHFWRSIAWLMQKNKPFCLIFGRSSPKPVIRGYRIAASGGK